AGAVDDGVVAVPREEAGKGGRGATSGRRGGHHQPAHQGDQGGQGQPGLPVLPDLRTEQHGNGTHGNLPVRGLMGSLAHRAGSARWAATGSEVVLPPLSGGRGPPAPPRPGDVPGRHPMDDAIMHRKHVTRTIILAWLARWPFERRFWHAMAMLAI